MNDTVANNNSSGAVRVPAFHLSQKTCAFCATRLDVHQAARGRLCANPGCRKKHLVDLAALRRQAEVADVQRIASEFRARVAPSLGVTDPESLTLAVVPYFKRPVARLARIRRMEFRSHLIRIVRQAFEEKLDEAGVSALAGELAQAVQSPPGFPEGGLSCATCRGHCCRTGGTHAYLNATVIRSHLVRHPGLPWRKVVQAFLDKLPATSFDYSCVYHGRRGCALPREMRSGTCNKYHCQGLEELRDTLAASGPGPVLIVATSGEKVGRSTLVNRDGPVLRVRKIPVTKP